MMNVGAICSREPIAVEAATPLTEVARLMFEHHVGAVIVTKSPLDRPVPVGMITDRDITRAQLAGAGELSRVSAASVMTRDPLVLVEDMSIDEAIGRMRSRKVRRAPIVSANGALIGIVSTDDLFTEVARELTALSGLLGIQPLLERLRRPVR
jgi:CBS domain-containing protein